MKMSFIFAHPDDESYGPSGTISLYSQKGAEVHLLTLSRGENGKLGICKTLARAEVAKLRTKELQCAAQVLQIANLRIGDFPDGKMAEIPDEHGVNFISDALSEIQPEIVITFYKKGITGHQDHVTVSRWTTLAVRKTKKINLFYFGLSEEQVQKVIHRKLYSIPNAEITHQIDVSDYIELKKKAIFCHASQIEIFENLERANGGFDQYNKTEFFAQVWPKRKYPNRQDSFK